MKKLQRRIQANWALLIALASLALFIVAGKVGGLVFRSVLLLDGGALVTFGVVVALDYREIAERLVRKGIRDTQKSGRWAQVVGPAMHSTVAYRFWGGSLAGVGLVLAGATISDLSSFLTHALLYGGFSLIAVCAVAASIANTLSHRASRRT